MFDTERFITEIHARECIWNSGSTLYHDKNIKRNAWIEIFNLISVKVKFHQLKPSEQNQKLADLQRKWKNIRDHFKKCSKALSRVASESSRNPKPYIYSEILSFLLPIIERKQRNIEDDEESIVTGPDYEEESNNDEVRIKIRPKKRQKSYSDTAVVVPCKKISKEDEKEEIDDQRLDRLNALPDKKEDDADKFFLLSLLPQIRELNIDQKNFLYIEFLQSIRKAKLYHPSNIPFPLNMNLQSNSIHNFETYSTQNTSTSSLHTECSADIPSPQYSETKDEIFFKME